MVESQESFFATKYEMGDNSPNEYQLSQIPTDELLNSNSCLDTKDLDFDSETLENNLNTLFEPLCSQPVQFPSHLQKLPDIDEMPDNAWKFNMDLKSEQCNKSLWLYSPNLNKIFVKMGTPMNVYPTFDPHGCPMSYFFIRAMIVYSSQNDLPEPVNKCPNHKVQGQGELADHILHCTNVGAEYRGRAAGKLFADKLAFRINMANIASNEPLTLKFTCQNSCSGGMNRKSTSLIFTLEDVNENILGRQVMHFKVCSCPRRDKEKDESTTKVFPKKRKSDSGNLPSTSAKRIHLTKQDSEPVLMDVISEAPLVVIKNEPEIPCELRVILPNEKFKKNALNFMYDAIAGEIARTSNTSYNCYLTDLLKQIDDN